MFGFVARSNKKLQIVIKTHWTAPGTGTISADEIGRKLLADWLRYKNGAADSNVNIRKAALQSLSLGLRGVVNQYSNAPTAIDTNPDADPSNGDLKTFREDLMAILMDDLAKTIFKSLADPSEACRCDNSSHDVTAVMANGSIYA